MKIFANLIHELDTTNKTTQKLRAIGRFLDDATDQDKLWFLALFTGKRPKRVVSTSLMKQWAIEEAGIPEWLFEESYAAVGDLAETLSLILPAPQHSLEQNLSEWMAQILALAGRPEQDKEQFVRQAWKSLPHLERFIFNKLIGGSFRLGLSTKGLINVIASHYQLEPSAVAHALMGDWNREKVTFDGLINGQYADTQLSRPYPFCLAHAVGEDVEALGDPRDWLIEYKWDGIRGQFIQRQGQQFIWSRGEELITDQFPEIRDALALLCRIIRRRLEMVHHIHHRRRAFAQKLRRIPQGCPKRSGFAGGQETYHRHAPSNEYWGDCQ